MHHVLYRMSYFPVEPSFCLSFVRSDALHTTMTCGYDMKVQEMAAKMDDEFTRQDYEDMRTYGKSKDDIS